MIYPKSIYKGTVQTSGRGEVDIFYGSVGMGQKGFDYGIQVNNGTYVRLIPKSILAAIEQQSQNIA
ncbi:hypothetical protein FACS189421_02900 [Bacteroidia bacterium]|nr:hypothetical protein FACS189421_02900 [Bacteroidia bacterium]